VKISQELLIMDKDTIDEVNDFGIDTQIDCFLLFAWFLVKFSVCVA